MTGVVTFKSEDEGDGTYEGQLGTVFIYDESNPETRAVELGWMTLSDAEAYAREHRLEFDLDGPTRDEWDEAVRLGNLPFWKRLLGRDR